MGGPARKVGFSVRERPTMLQRTACVICRQSRSRRWRRGSAQAAERLCAGRFKSARGPTHEKAAACLMRYSSSGNPDGRNQDAGEEAGARDDGEAARAGAGAGKRFKSARGLRTRKLRLTCCVTRSKAIRILRNLDTLLPLSFFSALLEERGRGRANMCAQCAGRALCSVPPSLCLCCSSSAVWVQPKEECKNRVCSTRALSARPARLIAACRPRRSCHFEPCFSFNTRHTSLSGDGGRRCGHLYHKRNASNASRNTS